jgi:hypothetical protein
MNRPCFFTSACIPIFPRFTSPAPFAIIRTGLVNKYLEMVQAYCIFLAFLIRHPRRSRR